MWRIEATRGVLCASVLAAVLVACGGQATPEKLLQEAKRYEDQGDYNAAVIQLKNALQAAPENVTARYRLGLLYLATGDAASAEKELRKALEVKNPPPEVWPALGKALLRQGDYNRVLEETKSVETDPRASPELLSLRGNAYAAGGKSEKAQASYDAALKARPDFADALLGKARLAASKRDYTTAAELTDRVLAKEPGNAEALLLSGELLRVQGKDEAALALYNKILEKVPGNVTARLSRASLLLAGGKIEEAARDVAAARKAQPNNLMGHYMQALLEYRKGNFKAAEDALQNVLRYSAVHLPSLLLAGAVEYQLGSLEFAEQHLRTVLDKMPNNVPARKLLGAVLIRNRQPQKAIEVLSPALKEATPDSAMLALLGEAYMNGNDYEQASQYLARASALDPKSAGLRTGLGASRLAAGDVAQAMADLESAVKLDTTAYQADTMLIVSHLSRKEFPQALAAVEGLAKKQPNNPLTYNLQGAAYLGAKDLFHARASFEHALKLDPGFFPASLNLAQLDIQENKPQLAQQRFEEILAKDKSNLQALIALAGVSSAAGNDKEALNWLIRAHRENPKSAQAVLALARHYLRRGEAKLALAVSQEGYNEIPGNTDVLDLLGLCQLAAGDKGNALSTFAKLAKLQPASPLPQMRIATAQLANDNTAAATLSLEKALEIQPNFLDAQVLLAGIHVRAGRFDEAMKIAQEVQQKAPKSAAGYEMEGNVLIAQKKPAAAAYEKAYAIAPSGPLTIKLHTAYALAGQEAKGGARLEQWLKANPGDAGARIYLADLKLKEGKNKEAAEHYEAVLKLQPQNLLVLNNLAWSLNELKDPRALDFAEQAYRLKPDNAAIIDTLGAILIERGQVGRGLELLKSAAERLPDSPNIRLHLAEALFKSGDKKGAREELERLLASGRHFPEEAAAQALLKQVRSGS
jgi:putative PEP-CTERM system TPR-repeat lipoprotein